MVKVFFKRYQDEWKIKLINKKVIVPNYIEKQKNKASRSAKLRVVELL
jgi:16S rRNA C1402 N4-methylase RsmH